MPFQPKTSLWRLCHFHAYNVYPGDLHDKYGRCFPWLIYWSHLCTRVTWRVSKLYINLVPVQCRMCPASASDGSLRESLCLSWWAVSRMQVWKCKLCCFGRWVYTGWSAPCQRWVYLSINNMPREICTRLFCALFSCEDIPRAPFTNRGQLWPQH